MSPPPYSARMRPSLNLLLRFLLELAALIGMGRLGWQLAAGPLRYAFSALLPLLAATVWGVFNVAGDPSRSGHAPVAVAGWLRLTIEALFFALGAYGYFISDARVAALLLSGLTGLHYALSGERVRWLLQR